MIHIHKPGHFIHLGLNIEVGLRGRWPWITFIWCWYNVAKRETYGWRLRIRTHTKPHFLFSKHTHQVIDGFLMENDLMLVERTLLEDQAPWVYAVAKHKAEQAAKDRLAKLMSV